MYGKERYQVSFHANNLPNTRWLKRSSPYVRVKIIAGSQHGTVLGETEHIRHCASPDWCKIFFVELSSDEIMELEVTIWDYVNGREPIWMGEARFEVYSVFQEPGNTKVEQIGRSEGSVLCCHVQKSQLGPTQGVLRLHLRGLDMKNVEPGFFGLGRSDPFFEIAKKNADYSIARVKWNVVYRSEYIDNNLNPYWRPATIGLEELCYGKIDWPLKIAFFDYNNNGSHRKIGEFETTIPELQSRIAIKGNADREQAIPITKEGKYKTYGLVCILVASLLEGPSNV